ncbi:kielin/chordin-like protein [Physella acuta]|uniref:kielin/chordin-like protein n=1 Tax=Physella acuta TaxID=109671 RepID=UPI0027DCB6BE|nr:kielin/chordin-like protein [Physella acuta]
MSRMCFGEILSTRLLLMLMLILNYGSVNSIPVTPAPKATNCAGLTNPGLNNPCMRCSCVDGQFECMIECCKGLECVDGVIKPGACCPTCPNGKNCKINGRIVPIDSRIVIPGLGECLCGPPGEEGPETVCFPVTQSPVTTTTTTTTTTPKPATLKPKPLKPVNTLM